MSADPSTRPELPDELAPGQAFVLRILWAAFIATQAIFAGVLVFVGAEIAANGDPEAAASMLPIFAALALLRRFRRVDRDLRGTGWAAGRAHADEARELSGLRMGIVGMGNVGRAIHRIAQFGFSMAVSATTRTTSSLPEGVTALDLDTLMAESDVVVLCCPLTPETTGLINRERIGLMKRDALLINVSRGPVVDQQALVTALRDRRIGGAALDVFESQPLDPADPLFGLDNVVLTPHLAGITQESMRRMGEGAARETQRVLAGDVPLNFRNPDVLEAYRRRFPKP